MDSRQTEQFATLWTSAQATISGFIRTLIPDYHQAEEVLQRVAVVLVRKFENYDQARPFAAWAIGVAKFEVLYFRRQYATDKHVFDDEIVERVAISFQRIAEDTDPRYEALEQCIDELEGRAKEVLDMRYGRELKSGAIADEMKLSTGAVRMLLCRVRAALRVCVERRILKASHGKT